MALNVFNIFQTLNDDFFKFREAHCFYSHVFTAPTESSLDPVFNWWKNKTDFSGGYKSTLFVTIKSIDINHPLVRLNAYNKCFLFT